MESLIFAWRRGGEKQRKAEGDLSVWSAFSGRLRPHHGLSRFYSKQGGWDWGETAQDLPHSPTQPQQSRAVHVQGRVAT